MPKISIIVPVYKVEIYLRRCLDSIVAQTFTDWECILVDDGSPDNSGKICDEYAEKDNRFRVFHQANAGVSAARNKGLDEAKGEWIGFVDSDDWMTSDYFQIDYPKSDIIQKRVIHSKKEYFFKCDTINKEKYYFFFVNRRTNSIFDKIIRRDIIAQQRFNTNVKIGEDFLFVLSITENISSYSFSNQGAYFYNTDNTSSAMHSIANATERMTIIENNIHHIESLVKSPEYFKESIIYQSYLPFFLCNKQILSISQKELLTNLLNNLSFNKLRYLSLRNKIKTYKYKLKLLYC